MKSSRPNPPGNAVLRILCCTILPFRLVVYLFFMTILLPLTVVLQCIRAPCKRCCNGKPSDILHKKMIPWRDSMGGYCYQLIFDKKIDFEKLKKCVVELAAEFGVEEKDVLVENCSKDSLKKDPTYGAYSAKHYVGKDWNMSGNAYTHIVGVRLYNGGEGEATIIHGKGCWNTWDGSSNFNFAKEYLTRYAGKGRSSVAKGGDLDMTDEAKEVYDNASFCTFLCCQLPHATVVNFHKWAWRLSSFPKCCGGGGVPNLTGNTAVFNLDVPDSTAFYDGAKKLGAKPYSALTWVRFAFVVFFVVPPSSCCNLLRV